MNTLHRYGRKFIEYMFLLLCILPSSAILKNIKCPVVHLILLCSAFELNSSIPLLRFVV